MIRCCVFIPFLGRLEQVAALVGQLLPQCQPDTAILLVNDGGAADEVESYLQPLLQSGPACLLHHEGNRGVAAARNTAIDWCREREVELLVMVDSDCRVDGEFISGHRALHREHPEVACFGCGVVGTGRSLWADLDRIVSWVHAMPLGAAHPVPGLYHLPTTNFSVKLAALNGMDPVFDARLNTGEDALLIRRLRERGAPVWFAPRPRILHADRERLRDVIAHHYAWGHHQYFVQLGNNLSARAFNPFYRALFLLMFLPLSPLYALAGASLNLLPWLRHRPRYLLAFPAVYGLWLAKSVAVMEAAVRPRHCLRPPVP